MSDRVVAKVMADMRHNLRLGHFISRFHGDEMRAGLILLETLFQFALGLAGPQDQNGSRIAKIRNDLIIVAREVSAVISLARIIGGNSLVFKSARGGLAGTPKLLFHA